MRRRDFIAKALELDTQECILWPYAVRKSSGYGALGFKFEGRTVNIDAHRHVCILAHGPAPKDHEVGHRCGQKLCINPKHLRWVSHLRNMKDAIEQGNMRGGGRYRQRIFARDLADIRASEASHVVVAAQYGLEPAYVGRLRRG